MCMPQLCVCVADCLQACVTLALLDLQHTASLLTVFTDCVYRRLLLLLISLAERPFPYVLAVVQKAESL